MPAQFVFAGGVDEAGKPSIDDLARYRATLQTLAGKRIELVIRKPKSKRSIQQNAWHWGIAIPMLAEALGYDRHEHDQLHYALVAKCFGVTRDARTGLEVPKARSSKLTIAQFSELMEWEARFAAEFAGVVLPMPGEVEP